MQPEHRSGVSRWTPEVLMGYYPRLGYRSGSYKTMEAPQSSSANNHKGAPPGRLYEDIE